MGLWGDPKKQINSTQEILRFAEIKDSVVITKTGELRAILLASSINFSLKSEQEQNAIIFAYQNFLNSLNFPVQILVQSKKLDLGRYLNKLKETANTQTNELLRIQTFDYIDFVGRLINIANIMDKKIYVVVPFSKAPQIQPTAKFKFGSSEPSGPQMTEAEFEKQKEELKQRVSVVQNGLSSIGIRSAQLETQQIIELLYIIYNPEEAMKEKLTQFEHLMAPVIKSELETDQKIQQG